MKWKLEKNVEVKLCQELVRNHSLSGKEGQIASSLEKAMQDLGYHEITRDRYGSVIGKIVLGTGGPRILFEGHMDHVDVTDPSQWNHDPFKAEQVGSRIYGRGTSDMKGNLAAMTIAAAQIADEADEKLNGEIYVVGSVFEEVFEGVASREISKICNPDFVVIGEASNLTIKRGQRGRAEVVIETIGKSAHSSNPSVGINAIRKMTKVLQALDDKFKIKQHPLLGDGILEVTDIISSPYPGASVIPDRCRATFDRRLLVGETKEEVLQGVRYVVEKTDSSDLPAKVYLATVKEVCYTGEEISAERFAPAWAFDENHPFVVCCMNGLWSVGQNPELSHYYFCTNGSHYAGEKAIPTIGYGGSLETLAHVVDEYIEIEQLQKARNGYCGIIRSVLSKN